MQISKDKVVSIHYTLKNTQGDIIDSSDGRTPLEYIQGRGNIIPGLEKELDTKKAGDKVNAVIAPEEAYGQRYDQLVQAVPKANFDNQDQIQVGAQFQTQAPDGIRIATVTHIGEDQVTVDLNHPLAGQTLHFDVEVMSVREATDDELQHGHVHGEGCHH